MIILEEFLKRALVKIATVIAESINSLRISHNIQVVMQVLQIFPL